MIKETVTRLWPWRRVCLASLVLIATLVAAALPAHSRAAGGDGPFAYVVPPKPSSPAAAIRPIPRPPGPPPWARNPSPLPAASPEGSDAEATSATGYQTTGVMSATLLAVDFVDNVASTNLSHYDDMLFDPDGYDDVITKSMRSYYTEVSYGGLDVTGEVYGKTKSESSSWVDWIRAPKRYSWYTAGDYGFGRYPRNAQRLTEDAVAAADPYVDFSAFTTHETTQGGVFGTFVSALFVVHAGPGAEVTGSKNDIWSHAWVTSEPVLTNDGVYVYRYIMMAEDSPMGTFGHEFGHTLGLPDLYDYDGSSAGIGAWGMMAYGTWNDDGQTPAHMSAWSKVQAGWVSPARVTDTTTVDVDQVEDSPAIYQLLSADGGTNPEYFLVENRQRVLFDTALPGDGLLIWHVDDTVENNDDETHYRVALEQADGLLDLENNTDVGDGGDPFPGGTNNRAFDAVSDPDSKTYDGSASGVAVTNIGDSDATMSATMTAGGDLPPGVTITNPADGATVSGTVSVTADASDDDGVTQVEFFVDSATIGTDSDGSDGWATSWDTTGYADGTHSVSATATDTSGQTASDTIGVLVDNVNDPPVADSGPDQAVVDADGDGTESVTLDASAGGTIAFDAASSAHTDPDASTLSWSHTTSGSDRIMLVGVTTRNNVHVVSLTYGGVGLTRIRRDAKDPDVGTELWVLIAPPEGTDAVELSAETATTIEAGATTWTGVGQTPETALGSNAGATGLGTTASVDVSSSGDQVVVDVVGTQHKDATVTPEEGQTERWNEIGTAGVGAASSEPGASTVTMSWGLAKEESWAISAVALIPTGGSYDPDGTITSYDWDFGDGTTGSGETVTHVFAVGSYTVTLTVTDDDAATDSDTVSVTVKQYQEPETMHIGDLDGASVNQGRTWRADVTITVHDASETPVRTATVTGTWSGGYSGSASCATDDNGTCVASSGDIRKNIGSTSFTVDDVTHSSLTYDAAANHDPDGDSDGTSITVYKP
ncbi:MAG: M6 family metalloprotease domain-containing protein [Anaerolineae bacterium]|jgi:immune inhibitor A